ncbi:conjugal transfer protein TraF [Colwellia asteriadis]|uniref:Conjugal transfer protein TraF n=1 Tax=Colwellia asteriadis TaxID=517723 RepID=A0ABN1L5I8_9GAMM
MTFISNNYLRSYEAHHSAITKPFFSKFLLLTLSLLYYQVSYADSFTAKRAGQGFTAITQDFTSSLSNPALLTKYTLEDDVYFSFNLGGMGSDQYNVIDIAEQISNDLSNLANDINNASTTNHLHDSVDTIIHNLAAIDNKVVNVRNGLNFQLIIPNKYLSFGLFTNQFGRIGGVVNYNDNDALLLEEAINQGYLDLTQLKSTANGLGYSLAEAGVMLGYQVTNNNHYEISIGSKLKYQRIDLLYRKLNISNFNEDEFDLNNDEYLTNDSHLNVDLGLYVAWGDERQWHAALVSDNLISRQVEYSKQIQPTDPNINFSLKPTTSVGFSYQNSWLTLATEIDLADREHFISLTPSKYVALGAEFTLFESVQLRMGLRSDLNDVDGDLYTLGFGISPWDVLAIDIAGFAGNNDTYGAALQLGLKI